MPIDVKAYRILIASPGDVIEERNLVREQIARWNSMNTQDRNIILLSIGWEKDSTPSLEDHPQAVINLQLVDSCDFLIGIFWNRLGTPTPEADSGTVEEIERAHNQGKKCIVYFSDKPVKPSGIDRKQKTRLEKFKKSLQSKALTDSYSTSEDFKEKVLQHINATVSKIEREDKERRAAEQEAKLTEQAISSYIKPGDTINHSEINIVSQPRTNSVAKISLKTLVDAQISIKEFLESRFGIQELEDIKEQEIARIQSVLASSDFIELLSRQPTIETVPAIRQLLERATIPSIYALASIGRYADDTSAEWLDIVGDWIERLSTRKLGGYEWASYLKTYPGLLLLYGIGTSSLRSGKLGFLGEVFSRQIYSLEYNRERPILTALKPWHVFYYDVSKIIAPGFEQRYTPVSDHLTQFLKETLYSTEDEARYLNQFDFFEFLISFKSAEQDSHPYFGSFTWRSDTRRFLIQMIQDAAIRHGKYGPAIQDLFGGASGLKETAKKYDSIVSQSQGGFGYSRPPGHISDLIHLAQSGCRVASYQELFTILHGK
jgi:nucleoside 2-deoxyribosyltransferase